MCPLTLELGRVAKALYLTRRAAGDLKLVSNNPEVIKAALNASWYAHDLEFLARQLGIFFDMPVSVDPPYLEDIIHYRPKC